MGHDGNKMKKTVDKFLLRKNCIFGSSELIFGRKLLSCEFQRVG